MKRKWVLSCSVTEFISPSSKSEAFCVQIVFLTQFSLCFKKPWHPLSYWINGLVILSLYFWLFRKNTANLYLKTKDLESLSSSSCKNIHFTCTKTFIFSTNSGSPKWQIVEWLLFPSIFWIFFLHCQLFSSKKKIPNKPSSPSLSHMWSSQQETELWHCIPSFWTWPLLLGHPSCVFCNATILTPR